MADALEQAIAGNLTSRSSTNRGAPSTLGDGFEPTPSTTASSCVPTNNTTSTSSSSGLSSSTTTSTVNPPPVQTGSGGFAIVKSVRPLQPLCVHVLIDDLQGHRDVPIPEYDDDDNVVYSDEEDWNM